MLLAVRAACDDLARVVPVDARQIRKLSLRSRIQIERAVVARVPSIANSLRGGSRFVGGIVSDCADLSAGFFECGLRVLRWPSRPVLAFFVTSALVRVVGISSYANAEEESRDQQKAERDDCAGMRHILDAPPSSFTNRRNHDFREPGLFRSLDVRAHHFGFRLGGET